jgi:hypothetical protein
MYHKREVLGLFVWDSWLVDFFFSLLVHHSYDTVWWWVKLVSYLHAYLPSYLT